VKDGYLNNFAQCVTNRDVKRIADQNRFLGDISSSLNERTEAQICKPFYTEGWVVPNDTRDTRKPEYQYMSARQEDQIPTTNPPLPRTR
jgi:hypothetical protein